MFEITLIGKSKPTCIILIHGLFTNSGFWLRYLHLFRESCLVLVSVDYDFLPHIEECIGNLKQSLTQVIGSKSESKVIAHSLGTYVALKLGSINNVESYHICPVYSAERKNQKIFVDCVHEMQPVLSHDKIYETLSSVNSVLNLDKKLACNAQIDQLKRYIPNEDLFFEYALTGNEISFEGDHFNIDSALNKVCQD
jgi:hypothetical protein